MSFPVSHFFDVPFLYFKLTLSSFLAWVVWDKCLINSNDNNFCYLYLCYMQWNVGGDWNSQGVQKLSQEMAFLWFCVDAHWMYSFYHLFFSRPKSTKLNNFIFTNLVWMFSIYARIVTINEASKAHKWNSQKNCQNLKVAHN